MSILSIQSHVTYGYVGNKAAVFPLQCMGYDVWPVNTVQFSNHTGYGKWQGDIMPADHIKRMAQGIIELGKADECKGILSGYMGSAEICHTVLHVVNMMREYNPNLLYLCDPIMGDAQSEEVFKCYVRPEVVDFFLQGIAADIITPNKHEAEMLSGVIIKDNESLKKAASAFISRGIKLVVITGIDCTGEGILSTLATDGRDYYIAHARKYDLLVNGTGDLFSSIFLGRYLRDRNLSSALRASVQYLQRAIENTVACGSRELQVLSIRYDEAVDLAVSKL